MVSLLMLLEDLSFSVEEKAAWRALTEAAFSRRPLWLLAQALQRALGLPADAALAQKLVAFRAGKEPAMRFFLGDPARCTALALALDVPEADLSGWLAQVRATAQVRAEPLRWLAQPLPPRPPGEVALPSGQELGAGGWLASLLDAARARMGEGAGLLPELTRLMTREAQALCQRGAAPTDPLPSPERLVEGELALATQAREGARIRALQRLLVRYREVRQEAGLCTREHDVAPRFTSAELPALLLGVSLSEQQNDELRAQCSAHRAWALAAWAATGSGDAVAAWLTLLQEEQDPLRRVDRALCACAALAGAPPPYTPQIAELVRLCVDVLVALCPHQSWPPKRRGETSPWRLTHEDWQQAVLHLARASLRFGEEEAPRWPAPAGEAPSGFLQDMQALGLPDGLTPAEEDVVRALCLPRQSAARGELGLPFFQRIFELGRVERLLSTAFLDEWMRDAGLPALLARPGSSIDLLVRPEGFAPAGYLLNRPGLVRAWYGAWLALKDAEPEALARFWVEAVRRLLHHHQPDADAGRALLEEAPARLRELGVWPQAQAGLRATLRLKDAMPSWDDPEDDPSRIRVSMDELRWLPQQRRLCTAVLQLAELTPPDWEAIIDANLDKPSLPWGAFLEARTAGAALSRWCIHKLRARFALERRPGALASAWEPAFEQAAKALGALLRQGANTTLDALASACLLDASPKTPPPDQRAADLAFVLGCFLPYAWLPPDERRPDLSSLPGDAAGGSRFWLALLNAARDQATVERLFAAYQTWLAARLGSPWSAPAELPLKLLMTSVAAQQGAQVSAALWPLLDVLESPPPCDLTPPLSPMALLSRVVTALCQHHPALADDVAARLLAPPLLAGLCTDDSEALWTLLLQRLGEGAVLAALAPLPLKDLGGGLFEALRQQAPERLQTLHLRPELLRPTLLALVEQRFTPAPDLLRRAFADPALLPPLDPLGALPAGPWLDELLLQSRAWPPLTRQRVLQRLAGFAATPEVRRACLGALLAAPAAAALEETP